MGKSAPQPLERRRFTGIFGRQQIDRFDQRHRIAQAGNLGPDIAQRRILRRKLPENRPDQPQQRADALQPPPYIAHCAVDLEAGFRHLGAGAVELGLGGPPHIVAHRLVGTVERKHRPAIWP
jgi:hypothetical protein